MDWVSGIEQKRPFRVGSPTFFSNPNINIPGINDGYDELFEEGLSCSDDDDFDFDSDDSSSPRKARRRSAAGETATTEDGVRIEFRGNQAEAIEDDEEERRRSEALAREREEERVMVQGFAWNEVREGGGDGSFDEDVGRALEELKKVVISWTLYELLTTERRPALLNVGSLLIYSHLFSHLTRHSRYYHHDRMRH